MSSFDIGPARGAGAVDGRLSAANVKTSGSAKSASGAALSQAADAGVSISAPALDAGKPPVDAARVSQIREAIETGNYPLLPQEIGDAMIAAGMLLRTSA